MTGKSAVTGADVNGRTLLRATFLAAAGWSEADLRPLAGDASFRRYFRLVEGGRRAMLMDAPPPKEDVRPFLRVAALLHDLGYSAPRILERDVETGFLLLEDLGDDTFTRLIARGEDEAALYRLAGDVLVDLHERFDLGADHGLPAYTETLLLGEAALLTDWFLPEATGTATSEAVRAAYLAAWKQALPLAAAAGESLVLRDFHIDNLMRLDGREGLRACGLLDFQDAVIGPAAYDLVSLVEDARRDVSPEVAEEVRARYLARRPGVSAEALDLAMTVLGAQRHAKVIGIFCRLARRNGKPVYLGHLPRLWRLLDRSLRHPALAPVRAWVEAQVPPDRRGVPAPLQQDFLNPEDRNGPAEARGNGPAGELARIA